MSRRARAAVVSLSSLALVLGVIAAAPATASPVAAPQTVLAPAALAPTSVSGWTTTAVSMKLGGELSRAVVVKPAAARKVLVQARKGLAGTVSTRATLTTSASGAVTARFVPPSTGTWYVRLAVKATATYAGATTAWRKVTVSGTAGATTASTPTVAPASVLLGASQKVSTAVKPAGARTVEVWAKAPGATTYAKRGATTSSSTGAASLSWKPTTAGTWTYKVYVRPSLTLKGAWSTTRSATVTAIPGQVTDLVATPGTTSVVLTWTNPTQFLDRISVVRTFASDPAPTTPVGGTSVALPGKIASTATDTGLTDSTAYRYTVFALDAKNNHLEPVSVTTTTLDTPPAAPTSAAADVESAPLQAALTWSNPGADLDHVVVRRTLASESAPASVEEGTAVDLASATATSVTDTGLAGGTEYRWSIFAVNANGTASAPTHITATAMGESYDWSVRSTSMPLQGSLKAIDCALSTFCAAIDNYGYVMLYDGSAWTTPEKLPGDPYPASDIACPFAGYCVAVTLTGKAYVYTEGAWGEALPVSGGALMAVSCSPGSTFCMAVGYQSYVFIWSATEYSQTRFIDASLRDVDCASSTYCALVGASGKTFLFTGFVDTVPQIAQDAVLDAAATVVGVDCPSASLCFYATDGGKAWRTGDGAATSMNGGRGITDISCSSTSSCFAVDYQGYITRYSGSSWGTPAKSLGNTQLVGVSCPDSLCFAIDTQNSRWGRWNGAAWTLGAQLDPYTAVNRVGCASSSFCVAGDQAGRVSRWNGTSWSTPVQLGSIQTITAIVCESSTFCMVSNSNGEIFRWDGASWTQVLDTLGLTVRTLDCVGPSWCVLLTAYGQGAVWDGSSWSELVDVVPGADFVDVSCPTSSFCLATTLSGQWLRYSGGTWDAALSSVPGPSLIQVECPTATFCVATDQAFDVLRWDAGAGAWGAPAALSEANEPAHLSCPTVTACTGIGYSPLRSITWSGTQWVTGPSTTPYIGVQTFSCAGARFCMAIDALNGAYVATR